MGVERCAGDVAAVHVVAVRSVRAAVVAGRVRDEGRALDNDLQHAHASNRLASGGCGRKVAVG